MKYKKDLNELAALEKLFAEDYGEQSIKNFHSGWDEGKEKEYLSQLKKVNKNARNKETTKTNIDGVLVSENALLKKTDRSCPVCKTYSFSGKDDLYMNRFKCCYECYIDFVEDREDRWKEGWRPDDERIQFGLKRRKQNG